MTAPIVPTDGEGSTDLDPIEATVPPEGPDRAPGRRRRRWVLLGVGSAFLLGLIIAMFTVKLPYYLVQPGSVRPAEQRIEIDGAESFETDGEVMFTTVYLSRATPALLIRAQLDDAVEVRTEKEMYPDGDRDASRKLNLQRMDLSKLTASRVALDYLGIDASYDGDGARVLGIAATSPSADLLKVGDVIVTVDGESVATPGDIGDELADRAPGDEVAVTVRRATVDGTSESETELELPLGESDTEPGTPVLGIQAEPSNPRLDSEVQVEVDSGDVAGPSAGLAWTLAIIDRLTPGSITDGRRVAVTGEILDNGQVGAIGGVVQKVAAVKRAGIDTFIYPAATPADEQAKMRRIAGDDVRLEPVETIAEAVEVLAPKGVELPA